MRRAGDASRAARHRRSAIVAALVLMATAASAQDGAMALRTRSLAASCAACHGTDGRGAPGTVQPAPPALAGMPAAALIEQMKAFKSGARPGSVMPQIAKGYADAQIEQLAEFYAKAAGAAR